METTFGKTVETRLIKSNNSNSIYPNYHYNQYVANKYNNSQLGYPNNGHKSINQPVKHPQSSIMLRKNYKYLFNNPSSLSNGNNGYLSDSECNSQRQILAAITTKQARDFNNNPNYTVSGRNFVQRANGNVNCYFTDNEDIADQKYCNRYRSIDRQANKKTILSPPPKPEFDGSCPNGNFVPSSNTRLIQKLLERSNRAELSNFNANRLNHLLSPKIPNRSATTGRTPYDSQSNQRQIDSEHLNNYLTWKNFNCTPSSGNSTTNGRGGATTTVINTEKRRDVGNGILSSSGGDEMKRTINLRSVSTPGTPLLSSVATRRPYYAEELKIETSNPTSHDTKPNQLKSHQANKLFINQYDPIRDQQKNDFHNLEQIERKQKASTSFHENNRSRSIPNRTERMNCSYNQSEFNYLIDRPSHEVISLENALLNMNEIIKNLTLIAQKKDEDLAFTKSPEKEATDICLSTNAKLKDLSPPLSTSTSLSFSTGVSSSTTSTTEDSQKKSSTSESQQHLKEQILKNISPASTSPSYSNSSIDPDKIVINKSNTSFSPSESSASSNSSNSVVSSNLNKVNICIEANRCKQVQQQVPTQQQHNSKINTNTNVNKNEPISFSKKLKRFLSINSSKNSSKRNL